MTSAEGAPSVRRSLALLLGSGAAIVGLVMLVLVWISVGTQTGERADAGDVPCLVAYDADEPGTSVRFRLVPPETVCTWVVDGDEQQVVVVEGSVPQFVVGSVLAVGGIGTCAVLLLAPRLRRARPSAA